MTLQPDCFARVLNGGIGGKSARIQHEIPLHKFPNPCAVNSILAGAPELSCRMLKHRGHLGNSTID